MILGIFLIEGLAALLVLKTIGSLLTRGFERKTRRGAEELHKTIAEALPLDAEHEWLDED